MVFPRRFKCVLLCSEDRRTDGGWNKEETYFAQIGNLLVTLNNGMGDPGRQGGLCPTLAAVDEGWPVIYSGHLHQRAAGASASLYSSGKYR